MAPIRNILFIMADQLRADCLSCYGHDIVQTPVIDRLASEGMRFTRAYVQAPVCGPSRMSFYTGRYAISHGATYNNFPLPVDQRTIGDHLAPLGVEAVLIGKTHMAADHEGMRRMGIDPATSLGVKLAECGFTPYCRDDGLHPDISADPDLAYNRYLRSRGWQGRNPWHWVANAAKGEDGSILSGWYMRHADLPARVEEADSETAWLTDQAIEFMNTRADAPFCLHLSYIKPHWPYMAPAPYHALYRDAPLPPANRSEDERNNAHPVHRAFMAHDESRAFSRGDCRSKVLPTYWGLIRQLDDHLGRLFAFMEKRGLMDNTLIVFTSDHGDYLGDHWLGEKELFHEESARIPLIIRDPRPGADKTRGQCSAALTESIDLLPSFVEALGGTPDGRWLEGRSLIPLLHGQTEDTGRAAVFSEVDYSVRKARRSLGLTPRQARAFMVRGERFKYIEHACFPPQLFDLEDDPEELHDLGRDAGYSRIRDEHRGLLHDWLMMRKTRTGIDDATIEARTGGAAKRGYLFGHW